ncbi:hypothetical protein KEM48_012676 [Puccinia striiformis f. sp. tritici PST-130]|nr:hypothetical protein KEM48_012676 [Puccinia striiformis f. sp. tritici PST-130]
MLPYTREGPTYIPSSKAFGAVGEEDFSIDRYIQSECSAGVGDCQAPQHNPAVNPICDIVGTGGDGFNTFNVSTTAAIVAAGAGVKVCKHGNWGSSSALGSAALLMAVGLPLNALGPHKSHN